MATNKYWNSDIYVIRTINKEGGGVSLYVGSTINFDKRKGSHKSNIYNENGREYNSKLYTKIRSNSGDWNMDVYKHFRCENKKELEMEEERIRVDLDADLNMSVCSTGLNTDDYVQYRKEYAKEYNKGYAKEYRTRNEWELAEQHRIYNANVITDDYFPDTKEYVEEYRTHNEWELAEQHRIYNANIIS